MSFTITLQNALIMAIDGMSDDLHTLTTYTSIFIWLITEATTLASLSKGLKVKDDVDLDAHLDEV